MKVVIIGNGIAGSTAARFLRKYSQSDITMISDEYDFPFSRTALMYVYMGHMPFENTKLYEDDFWCKNRISLKKARVNSINTSIKSLHLSNGEEMTYDKLIIATGSKSNKFGWPGQNLIGVQGLYHLQDLESMELSSPKKAVIVGGGLIGIEMAEMFHSRHIPVTMLVRENSFWDNILPSEESIMINEHIRKHNIDLRLSNEMEEIQGKSDKVSGVKTKTGEIIPCDFVGLTVGVSPNIEFVKTSSIKVNKGIVVDEYLQTNVEDIYAIGDCAELSHPQKGRRPVEAIWYTGRMMGQVAAHNICKSKAKYNPGVWFNSAKFFDIEYQVYGYVPSQEEDGFHSIYWQHPSDNKSIRIVYNSASEVVGFNLMGIRYRHEICEKWILQKAKIEQVLEDLSLANFDPEFFEEYEEELLKIYNDKSSSNLKLKAKRNLSLVQKFLNILTN